MQVDDVTFSSNLTIQLSGLGDLNGDAREIEFDNVNVLGVSTLVGSDSVDRAFFADSFFQGNLDLSLKDGNDTLDISDGIDNKNFFNAQTRFDGGNDDDTLDQGTDNLFASPATILNFETIV